MGTPGPTALIAAFGLFVISFSVTVSADKVWCYVCSHSPKDNRTDEWCTHENFAGDNTRPILCEKGCEYVETFDLNGELELFHRNCYRGNKSTVVDECEPQEKLKNMLRTRCTCTSDYCNSASNALPPVLAMLTATVVMLLHRGVYW